MWATEIMSDRRRALELAPEALFDHFVDLSGRLIKHGNASAAYHLLAASFECAKQLRSEEHLAQVERVAGQFQAQLDSESPTHELSAAAASERGMPALFVSLAHTAKAARVGVKSEADLERGGAMRQASE